jgi:hypothetical protein
MHHLSNRALRLVVSLLALAVLAAGAAVGSAALVGEDDTVVQACRHKVTGRLRAIASATACRSSEEPISWNSRVPPDRKARRAPRAIPVPGSRSSTAWTGSPAPATTARTGPSTSRSRTTAT